MSNQDRVKAHFETEAAQYDEIIQSLIPYYDRMVEALVKSLPFDRSAAIEVLDLGCGTGTIARAVWDAYPSAKITCLDISREMLRLATGKLLQAPDTRFINGDFNSFAFDKQYDAVVSSLALHHLETDADKAAFYGKIYAGLKTPGVFVNADVVEGPTEALQALYMEQWKSFMYSHLSQEEVDRKWLPNYYAEDRPVSMAAHFAMLSAAGFPISEIVWKYYNFAVYTALK